MKKIELSQGKFALVDDEDFEWLNQWNWNLSRVLTKEYAVRRHGTKQGGRGEIISMHRVIMGFPEGKDIDHKNGDGLNNQRSNLRICSRADNMRNKRKPNINNEPYVGIKEFRGVFKHTWRAIIGHNGITEHLGMFSSAELAAKAYDEAAKKYFGEFARLNFPED